MYAKGVPYHLTNGKFKSLESYQFVVVRVGLLSVAETLEVTGTPGCPGLDTSLAVRC